MHCKFVNGRRSLFINDTLALKSDSPLGTLVTTTHARAYWTDMGNSKLREKIDTTYM